MKTATYNTTEGKKVTVEYDETAPCIICGEPVVEASVGGTTICPWCDCGHCRYCGVDLPWHPNEEQAKKLILEHMAWHKEQKVKEKL